MLNNYHTTIHQVPNARDYVTNSCIPFSLSLCFPHRGETFSCHDAARRESKSNFKPEQIDSGIMRSLNLLNYKMRTRLLIRAKWKCLLTVGNFSSTFVLSHHILGTQVQFLLVLILLVRHRNSPLSSLQSTPTQKKRRKTEGKSTPKTKRGGQKKINRSCARNRWELRTAGRQNDETRRCSILVCNSRTSLYDTQMDNICVEQWQKRRPN